MNAQEFTLETENDILIQRSNGGYKKSTIIADFDVRDILDQIENKDIVDWKRDSLLEHFTIKELKLYIEDNE